MSCSTPRPPRDHRGGVGHSGRRQDRARRALGHRVGAAVPRWAALRRTCGYDPDKPLGPDERWSVPASWASTGRRSPRKWRRRAARYRPCSPDGTCSCCSTTPTPSDQIPRPAARTPSCLVLVTSRDTLPRLVARYGAHRVDLDLLPIADATALLRRLIGRRRQRGPDAAEALRSGAPGCPSRCASRPKLATSRPSATLAELVAELDEQKDVWTCRAGDDRLHRGAAVFSWSNASSMTTRARVRPARSASRGRHRCACPPRRCRRPGARGPRMLDVAARAHLLDVRGRAQSACTTCCGPTPPSSAPSWPSRNGRRPAPGCSRLLATASTIVDSRSSGLDRGRTREPARRVGCGA